MKFSICYLTKLSAVLALTATLCASIQAQTFQTLRSFGFLTNKTGMALRSRLVMDSDGMLYGTASEGGGIVRGTVFKIGADGAGFALLKQFTNLLDGANPKSGLLLSGTTLYGTTSAGGSEGGGTIFRMNTDGSGFTVLKALPAGSYNRNLPPQPQGGGSLFEPNPPMGGLALSGTTLYGTTRSGGGVARGTVFKLETDGSGYSVVKEFSGANGAAPTGDLVISGSTLYGTTSYGGSANKGSVFKISTDGSGFTVLKSFTGPDGAGPYAGLVLSDGTLFGVTVRGGAFNSQAGTIFKINTDGSDFATLKSFNPSAFPPQGLGPMGRLALSDGVLYGTAATLLNFTPGIGTLFRLNTDGSGFATVIAGIGGPGSPPFFSQSGVVVSGNTIYGTTSRAVVSSIPDEVFKVDIDGSARTTLRQLGSSSGDAMQPTSVTLADGMLYGASRFGGVSNAGAIFAIRTNGSSYELLKSMNGTSDGGNILGRPTVIEDRIYGGTINNGNSQQIGTLFRLTTNGTGFAVIHNFSVSEGFFPDGISPFNNVIYGSLESGGDNANGTIFRMNPDGSGFKKLHDFVGPEGAGAVGEPVVVGNVLYGVAGAGGQNGLGTIFRMSTNGVGFTVLHHFAPSDQLVAVQSRLTLAGETLYGICYDYASATVFRINTNGSGFGAVTRLEGQPYLFPPWPGGLTISESVIYGVTGAALFQVNTDGTGLRILKLFQDPLEGIKPNGDLVLAGATLYGTTSEGGELNEGTIFSFDLRPRLAIARNGSELNFSWPSTAADYQLEQNPMLVADGWTNVAGSVSDDGTNRTLTLPSSSSTYYRLRR